MVLLALMPKPAWTLFRAKLSKKPVLAIANDSGIVRFVLAEPKAGWFKVKKTPYIIVDAVSGEEVVSKKRFILEGLWRPFWIAYDYKASAVTPEALKYLEEKHISTNPGSDVKAVMLLDPRDVRKDVTLRVNKSVIAYMYREAQLAGKESDTTLKALVILLAVGLIIAVAAIALLLTQQPQAAAQAAEAAKKAAEAVNASVIKA